MGIEFIGSECQLTMIHGLATAVYQDLLNEYKDNSDILPHCQSHCIDLSQKLARKLRRRGFEPRFLIKRKEGMIYHVFNDLGNNWVTDLGWSTFLDEPPTQAPEIMLTQKKQLPEVLTRLGIKPELHEIWTKASVRRSL